MGLQNDYTRELFNGEVGPIVRLDVLPLHTQHFEMLQRNLLYTAVTRGKQVVVVVGSRQALEIAVRNVDTSRRYSQLTERLRAQQ